jgi:hypothetical protein
MISSGVCYHAERAHDALIFQEQDVELVASD